MIELIFIVRLFSLSSLNQLALSLECKQISKPGREEAHIFPRMGQKMCDFFPPAGYWLTHCKEKISRDSEVQLNNILSLDVYQNSGKSRPEMDSLLARLPTFSVFIGLDYLEKSVLVTGTSWI